MSNLRWHWLVSRPRVPGVLQRSHDSGDGMRDLDRDLRDALTTLCDEADTAGKEPQPAVSTDDVRAVMRRYAPAVWPPRIAPGVPRWFGLEER